MIDFFAQQEAARRRTWGLIAAYVLAVIAVVLAIAISIAALFGERKTSLNNGRGKQSYRLKSELVIPVGGGVLLLILLGTTYKLIQLGAGGSAVAQALGGVRVSPHTTDPDERKLLNVVEEMALASGMHVPPVYLLQKEGGINAFAAGFSLNDAVIGVTRGAILQLGRDELQGVIAHEFSHILNGDMRLNLRMIGVLHGLVAIALAGKIILRTTARMRSRGGKNDPRPALFAIGGILFVLGSLGMFAAKLIKLAVSRQREFLADASAVQYTRNPLGLAGALKQIAGFGSKLRSERAEEASHLFFADGLRGYFSGLLSTHPPVEERIKRLDASFSGQFIPPIPARAHQFLEEEPSVEGLTQLFSLRSESPRKVEVSEVVENVGHPTMKHLSYVQELLNGVPDELRRALRSPLDAMAVVFSLLMEDYGLSRIKQLEKLRSAYGGEFEKLVVRYAEMTREVSPYLKLPLIDLASEALVDLSKSQFLKFESQLSELIYADGRVSLFEFSLARSLVKNLTGFFRTEARSRKVADLFEAIPEFELVLSVLSWLNTEDRKLATRRFDAALASARRSKFYPHLSLKARLRSFEELDGAFSALSGLSPAEKNIVIEATISALLADGEVAAEEIELMRAMGSALDCPIPPLLPNL
jgi:Zn-dependent protease with chaperone function